MRHLISQRYIIRKNLLALIGISLFFYFSYHLVMGERSYLRLMALEKQISVATQSYDGLHAERVAIEKKVTKMRPGSMDKDLLEERVKIVLGYSHSDESIIYPSSSL